MKKTDYKNWIPETMIFGFAATAIALFVLFRSLKQYHTGFLSILKTVAILGFIAFVLMTIWLVYAYRQFSYEGKRKLSKQIVEKTAEYVKLPEEGIGLDVGCGSGALTIACARNNPQAKMLGIDRWGPEYASYSQRLCEENAKAEGIDNVSFSKGNAIHLDFPDETFDCVTSNYVYHNITGRNKQELLKETLRVLKKGGSFAIHDLMSPARYGDMDKFIQSLKDEGYEEVKLIDTTDGLMMSKKEAAMLLLSGSYLLTGRK